MANDSFDFLVIGSTPLGGLVAGLLQTVHNKRVALVADPFSPFRLRRSLDLSITPLTRPETLALLRRSATETTRLVNSWEKGLAARVDPLFVAETPQSADALRYFRQLAITLGYAVEPVADRKLAEGTIVRVRDAQWLAHGRFETALEAWLGRAEVRRLGCADTTIIVRRDGGARFSADGHSVEAGQVILADDAAILTHLDEEERDRSLEPATASAFLVEPGKAPAAPLLAYVDRGVVLAQDGKASLAALASGDVATMRARLASVVSRPAAARVAGEVSFGAVRVADGAPFIGQGRGTRAVAIAGLGLAAAFYAPAIARYFAGVSSPDEAEWFAARGPSRGNLRLKSSDYAAVPA